MSGSEFAIFNLDRIHKLPAFVKMLLSDRRTLAVMAENGYERCLKEHTWDVRAEHFEKILKS